MFHMLTTTEYAPVTDQDTLRRLLTRIGRRGAGGAGGAIPLYPGSGIRPGTLVPPERAGRAGPHPGRLRAGVGPRGAVPPHRLAPGLDPDRVPEPLPDTMRRGGAPRRAQRRGMDAIPAEDRGLDAVERTLLRHALAALGEEERQIVLLHAVAGMKHREIAALLEAAAGYRPVKVITER